MPGVPTSIWRVPGMPALALVATLGFSGFAVLVPVAPLWAATGGADPTGAGLVGGVMLAATVATQGFVPPALRRYGWGPVLAIGLVLLGAPSLLMGATSDLPALLVLSAVRGIGFGALTVCGGAAVAELVEPARRGAGVGAYGVAVAVPNVVVLPTGPWLAEHVGFWVAFAIGAAPLLGVPAAFRLGRAVGQATTARVAADTGDHTSTVRGVARLLRPTAILVSVTLAGGGLLTFAPQMVDDATLATAVLFLIGAVAAVTRWNAGSLVDRSGAEPFVWPLVIVTVAGLVVFAWGLLDQDARAWALVVGATLVGISYGALQNFTLVLAFQAVPHRRAGLASVMWNVGFDAGTAVGSVLIGLLATEMSFPAGLFVTAAICATALPIALLRPARRELR